MHASEFHIGSWSSHSKTGGLRLTSTEVKQTATHGAFVTGDKENLLSLMLAIFPLSLTCNKCEMQCLLSVAIVTLLPACPVFLPSMPGTCNSCLQDGRYLETESSLTYSRSLCQRTSSEVVHAVDSLLMAVQGEVGSRLTNAPHLHSAVQRGTRKCVCVLGIEHNLP